MICRVLARFAGFIFYIIGMDRWNYKNMLKIAGSDKDHKLSLLLDYTDHPRDVADPWYTGDFEQTYEDVTAGCRGLLDEIRSKHRV